MGVATRRRRPAVGQMVIGWHEEPAERWLPIAKRRGYEVSDRGNVRSWLLAGSRGVRLASRPRLLSQFVAGAGYYYVDLGRTWSGVVHRLVLEAFVGPCPDGMECRHLDGNQTNNWLDNLAWGTKQENEADKIRHGTLVPATPPEDPAPILFADRFIPVEAILPREVWKAIPDHIGYEVSNFGRVRSYWGRGVAARRGLLDKPSLLMSHDHPDGRVYVRLKAEDRKRKDRGGGIGGSFFVHCLVTDAFSPRPSPGLIRRHVDGNPANNHIANLRWGTYRENARDKIHHGTILRGERCPAATLTEDQVIEIRRRLIAGEQPRRVAEALGCSCAAVYGIRSGRTWRHVV